MKIVAKILLIAVFSFMMATVALGFSPTEQDCSKCHTMTSEDAQALLRELNPNIKVLSVIAGPVKGLWEVNFELGDKKIVYFDFSKKFFFSGDVLSIKEKKNVTQERLSELNKVDIASIPLDDALLMGSKNAKYKVIVFDDPD